LSESFFLNYGYGIIIKNMLTGEHMDLKIIKQIAFKQLGDKSSHSFKEKGNKYYHGERVAKLVMELRSHIFPDDNSHDEILTVAAWFHDIMNGMDDHAILGAVKTRELLKDFCSPSEMDKIYQIISVHDDRRADPKYCNATLRIVHELNNYIKLQQDADLLDHFGTYDVWTEVLYAVYRDETIADVIDWFQTIQPKLAAKHRVTLNFELSKRIFDEKNKFLKTFGERLSVEFSGGFWALPELLTDTDVL
jgi:uncharacterized protein